MSDGENVRSNVAQAPLASSLFHSQARRSRYAFAMRTQYQDDWQPGIELRFANARFEVTPIGFAKQFRLVHEKDELGRRKIAALLCKEPTFLKRPFGGFETAAPCLRGVK